MAQYSKILALSHYLPLRTETKIYQRRKVMVEKPVFPGYFFVKLDNDSKTELLKTNNVVKLLEPDNQRILLHQLAQIRKALRIDHTLNACKELKKGKAIRITTGPFRGLEGHIDKIKHSGKIMLNVDMIGQAIAVEVDMNYIELLD